MRVRLVVADGGLAPHTQLAGLVEVRGCEADEQLRPRGVQPRVGVEADGVRYDVTTVGLREEKDLFH